MAGNNSKNGWSLNRKVSMGTVLKVGALVIALAVGAALGEYRLQQVEAKATTFVTQKTFAYCMEDIRRDIAELKGDVKKILSNQGSK